MASVRRGWELTRTEARWSVSFLPTGNGRFYNYSRINSSGAENLANDFLGGCIR